MPSAEPSPRPWRIESDNLTLRPPVCFVVDANGAKVSGGFFSRADAALIVDAVNERAKFEEARMEFPDFRPVIIAAGQRDAAIDERDRLRDIVKVLIPVAEMTLTYQEAMKKAGSDQIDGIKAARNEIRKILAEAREAIGEDKE